MSTTTQNPPAPAPKSPTNYLSRIILVAVFLLGVMITRCWYQEPVEVNQVDSTVLVERIRDVCKLVTIEADFRELYDEKNNQIVTWYLPLPTNFTFSKKASIEVKGKVLVGYDLKEITVEADSINKIIRIGNIPRPEILSIDHDVKYRDIEESYFNGFTANDFTELNKKAKEVLRQKAFTNHLLDKAAAQGTDVLNVIEFMVKGAGWKVEFNAKLFEDVTKRDSLLN